MPIGAGSSLNHYTLLTAIGKGGMGEVWKARDTKLGREVAIKMLPDAFSKDPERLARFEREAKLLASLNHTNIAAIYGFEEDNETHFLVMEYVPGETLAERIKRGAIPVEEALPIATQIAQALEEAHEKGIIHRDLKPANIKVTSDGKVKVLDFGLAKLSGQESPELVDSQARTLAHQTDSGVVMGTACYMSPEQARGQRVDARTDIFSLGVVIYELLAGQLPFEGSTTYEIVAAILSDREPQALSRFSPVELERIVGKALRKNREERYQTIKDLLVDLRSLRQHLEFESARQTRRSREDKAVPVGWIRARRTPLLVVVLLVLVGGAIGYAWQKRTQALSQPEIQSLAVLPLKNLDAGENYLGLGIADAAIRRISQTGRVIVRPTSAVRRYLNEDIDALAAAKQLGVDSVLEGSFQRADERLRVSVNLLRSSDGASLWTDSFDLRMADIFTIQDTVSQQVASRLRLQLDTSQKALLTKRSTSNPIAYEFYLKGVYAFDQRVALNKAQMENTIGFFKRAIEADPNFALAHAQLAYCYAIMAVFLDPTQPAWVERAKEELNRAQALDPQLAETHLVRFQLLFSEYEGYQGAAAVREVLMAKQLNPNVGHGELAYLYSHLGLEDLAARELERGAEIDPTSEFIKSMTLLMYEVGCKYDEYAAYRNIYHEDWSEVWYLMGKGRLDEAQKALVDWSAKRPDDIQLPPKKALLLALKADFRAAKAEIPVVLGKHPRKDPFYHHAAYDIALVYALEGRSAEAVQWLREAAATGYQLYPRYERDTLLDRIRQAPEFKQFLAEMKTQNDRYQGEFAQRATTP